MNSSNPCLKPNLKLVSFLHDSPFFYDRKVGKGGKRAKKQIKVRFGLGLGLGLDEG